MIRATRLRAFGAALAAALLLAACASGDKPKPLPLETFTPSIAGRVVWQGRLDSVQFPLVVAARGDAFLVGGSDGTVLSLDAANGREQWRASAGAALAAGVGTDGRFTSVVTVGNELVTFEGGVQRWKQRLPARVSTPPVVAGERVFVMAVDRAVHAFDAVDGRKLWTYRRAGDALTLSQPGVLTVWRNQLISGQGARIAALDPLRGNLLWEVPLATPRGTNEVERLADLVGPAVRVGDSFCARSFQAAVGCVDAARGVLIWNRNSGGTEAIGGDADLLVGADASSRVSAWKTATGEVAWSHDRLLYRDLSAPLIVGRTVVFGDLEGQVHFLAREDGRTLLRVTTDGSPVAAPPALAGNTLLVVTRKGGLFALRPE